MTPEAQRIAIAKACPDLFIHVPSPFGPGGLYWRTGHDENGNTVSPGVHVDPLNDLNAMHEAEKVLTFDQQIKYLEYLALICEKDVSWFQEVHATAAERAEACL